MGRPKIDVPIGARFGEWVVLEEIAGPGLRSKCLCRCSCGAEVKVLSTDLRRGKSLSCKCCANRKRGSHLESGDITVEYRAWKDMNSRCSPKYVHREWYFDRGIAVCEEWCGDGGFQSWLDHVGRRPSDNHSLDRIDNDKGYEPGNVRWATPEEQQGNRRNSRVLTIDGEKAHLAEWARRGKIHPQTIRNRLVRGWSDDAAVFTPVRGC